MKNKKLNLVDFPILSRKYKTLLTTKHHSRKPYVAPNLNEIKSYIPGTIIKMKAKVGAKLKEGDIILIQEAMKMMNQIKMPFDGKIKEILVSEGERIPKGHLMVIIE
ncbi:MAG TPA: acetyl-CoA carboxylase biotin carboxyl carrier protein subunit [Marinilabiliaceae bacterium]|nr:acetyl-CoA carboxylase biotin carboxyl carrier protein subunit [Marinilabiliaceae bacterium]